MKALKFTIDRSKWSRGGPCYDKHNNYQPSLLLNGEGKMCCLGFYALACGLPREAIDHLAMYHQLTREHAEQLPPELVQVTTDQIETALARNLATANDEPYWTDQRREQQVRILFASVGVEVDFIDKVDSCEKCGAEQGLAHLPSCPEYPAYLKDV